MKKCLETRLFLTHPALSIRDFNQIKKATFIDQELSKRKEYIDRASLYIIAKREVPVIIPQRKLSNPSNLVFDIEIGKNTFRLIVPALFNKKYSLNGFAGVKTNPENLEKAQRISIFSKDCNGNAINTVDFTFDELLYYNRNNELILMIEGNFIPAITYEVLYVGECVKENLSHRFKSHHALQDMLIEEKAISSEFDKSDELILLPFNVDSYISTMITGYEPEEELEKVIIGDFDITGEQINLDAEKALVHGMNPKYNCIRFKKYPFSKDGLYKSDVNLIVYYLAENMILKYDSGSIIGCGCSEQNYGSAIVGSNDGFTNIFSPGENYSEHYAKEWYTEHIQNMVRYVSAKLIP